MVGGRTWRFHCTNVRMCRFLTVSLSTKAPSSRIRVCLKTEIVFSVFEKKIRVHTLRSWMVFARPKENAIAIETGTSFDENMRINWYPSPWRHRFHEPPFPSIHTSTAKRRRQKSLLWRAFLKTNVFGDRFYRIRVDGRPNWRKKNPFSNKNLHVDGTKASLLFFTHFPEKNSNNPSRIIIKTFPVDMHAAGRPTKPETSMA